MKTAAKTDVGLRRKENQDRNWYGTLPGGAVLAIVCDGMGGENAGSVASELTLRHFVEMLQAGFREDMEEKDIRNLMTSSIVSTNSYLYERACEDASKAGMGTTCVAAVVYKSLAYIINIGDSRAYHISGATISQVTKDHTMVRLLVDQGKLEESDIKQHPQRNYITRAVGAEPTVSADYYEQAIAPEDVLLLCSDGLSSYCEEERIREIISENSLQDACDQLIDYANERGGHDNVTVVLLSDERE